MYKVSLTNNSINYLWDYFDKYRKYFENLYQDSWIWSENQIINSYIDEAKNRKIEVLDLIKNTLEEENVLWRKDNYSIIIKWRTKYIFIDFEEDNELRERFLIDIWISKISCRICKSLVKKQENLLI